MVDKAKKKAAKTKTTAQKPSAKKATAKKATVKKATAKKAVTKKVTTKKAATKTATVKKSATKKAVTQKTTAKKATVKKAAAKKTSAKTATVSSSKKSTAKKAPVSKTTVESTTQNKKATKKTMNSDQDTAPAPAKNTTAAAKSAPKNKAKKASPAAPKPALPNNVTAISAIGKKATTSTSKGFIEKNIPPMLSEYNPNQQIASSGGATIMGIAPYQPTPSEPYMNSAQYEHFRQILSVWKQSLMEEVDRIVTHMKDEAANFPDPSDRATQEEEFGLALRARDRERKLIKKIDEALERIKQDDYGYCETCGVEIGIRRLEARPTATLCIDCKTLDEIKERQMRS